MNKKIKTLILLVIMASMQSLCGSSCPGDEYDFDDDEGTTESAWEQSGTFFEEHLPVYLCMHSDKDQGAHKIILEGTEYYIMLAKGSDIELPAGTLERLNDCTYIGCALKDVNLGENRLFIGLNEQEMVELSINEDGSTESALLGCITVEMQVNKATFGSQYQSGIDVLGHAAWKALSIEALEVHLRIIEQHEE